ncbi:hypothetical protein IID62_07225 [candidate division KSB1 bacterium]|nr:hypothetical protein [candidate division KSB1 bacterium]
MFSTISGLFPVVMLVFSSVFAQSSNKPCENNPEYAKLNFWAGEWDVFYGNGVKAVKTQYEKFSIAVVLLKIGQEPTDQKE